MTTGEVYKIAIVGTENSHATEIIKYLNVKTARRRAEVVALAGEQNEHNAGLMELGGITTLVEDSKTLIGSVDALIVTNRDGAAHYGQADPFLAAGIPVWVDKPLACSTDDARSLINTAERTPAPLTSYSPLRWLEATDRLTQQRDRIGDLQTVTMIGPADPGSEYGGIFFYGIHCADVAQRIAPGTPTDISSTVAGQTVIVGYDCGGVDVTLQLVKPDEGQRVPFHCVLVGRHGVAAADLELTEGYVEPGIEAFLGMLDSGRPPLGYDEIIHPIIVMEKVREALDTAGH